jgi:1-acyl-sn-glycerol-3-phosphate acyltransferase
MSKETRTAGAYDDIRPYTDEEIPQVLRRLAGQKELIKAFRSALAPKIPRPFGALFDEIIRLYLYLKLKNIRTVEQFQRKIVVDSLLHPLVKKTTDGLTYSGLEKLDPHTPYLIITNHRDIVLDPALLNYILLNNGYIVSEIGFGDNLLFNDLVADVIRMNRAFIVKRNLPMREQFNESLRLSQYIRHVLKDKRESVWIAQRPGRAKDGMDATNPAVLKMIYFAHRREKVPFEDFLAEMKIVPVSISYEFDPCDRMKAWEVYRSRTHGGHKKRRYEDLVSIMAGIKGFKGGVHYHFGEPITSGPSNEKELAEAIDESIHKGYKLWATNRIAYDVVNHADLFRDTYSDEDEDRFFRRFRFLNRQVTNILLEAYANPVVNKMLIDRKRSSG